VSVTAPAHEGPIIALVMNEKTWRCGRRYAELAFMTCVTALLLALVARETRNGLQGLSAIAVYAFAAGFGLEFVGASWSGRWRPGNRRRQLQR